MELNPQIAPLAPSKAPLVFSAMLSSGELFILHCMLIADLPVF